jgi:hypothetical protein
MPIVQQITSSFYSRPLKCGRIAKYVQDTAVIYVACKLQIQLCYIILLSAAESMGNSQPVNYVLVSVILYSACVKIAAALGV